MTETPTPTPAQPTSPNVAKNKRTLIVVGAVAFFIFIGALGSSDNTPAPTPTTPTTISISDRWTSWKAGFEPVVAQTQGHYNQTTDDLSNADIAASADDFVTLAADANIWLSYANSPSEAVNADIRAVSLDLKNIANTGLIAMNGGSLSDFSAACEAFGRDTDQLANDLGVANSTF